MFFLYAAAAFAVCQRNFFVYISEMPRYSLVITAVFFIISIIMILIGLCRPNLFYALAVIPAVTGVYFFYLAPLKMAYYVFFGIMLLFLYGGFIYDSMKTAEAPPAGRGSVYKWVFSGLLISSAGMAAAILYVNYADPEILWFFPFRIDGYKGNMNWYDGINYEVFREFSGLLITILYLGAVIFFARLVASGKVRGVAAIIAGLVAAAFLGKIAFSLMTTMGIGHMEAKIKGPLMSTYYYWAARSPDIGEFIANYASKYQSYHNAAHLKGHPPMQVVFYWLIITHVSKSPLAASLIYGFITALGVIPFFFLTRHLTGSLKAGFFAALLYALTPNSLIMSVAGTEGMITFLTVLFLAMAVIGASKNSVWLLLFAGLCFGLNTYFHFGIWPLLMFVFLMIMKWEVFASGTGRVSELLKWAGKVFVVLAGVAAAHLIIWMAFKGTFDYVESINKAKELSVGFMLTRPYEIWSWANFFHWAQYITPPVLALFVFRFFRIPRITPEAARFAIMALAMVFVQFTASLGRAETHRMYMYLIAFVVPVAAMALLRPAENNEGYSLGKEAVSVAAMTAAYSVLLQVFVADLL